MITRAVGRAFAPACSRFRDLRLQTVLRARGPRWPYRLVWTSALRPRLDVLAAAAPASPDQEEEAIADVMEVLRSLKGLEAELADLKVSREQEADKELQELYDSEIDDQEAKIGKASWRLELEILEAVTKLRVAAAAQGKEDSIADIDDVVNQERDVILEVGAGVGGQEASFFAEELWTMYERFAESRGFSFEETSLTEGAAGGIQTAIARITGMDVDGVSPYGWLASESGVHRVQRVPSTDKKGRMQTSSATVVLLPVAGETDVEIKDTDVDFQISKKSSGPGGQSVNAAHSAVRATHIPTGIVVTSTTSPSQIENKARTLELIRTRILSERLSARTQLVKKERGQQRGTGDRSEKFRTYNFQRDEVVDHELGKDAGKHSASDVVMDSGLQALLEKYRERAYTERLQAALSLVEAAHKRIAS
eukprot:TRINITY_DN81832_c0_g1_i1.p1 TRINITY_DN81832_c0_g1~~TRINITY_DN81832_c0_g1_i1.p1  ORF type:complete len:423 (-),score=100.61 TRINITY_DN81832_c0_g1_i1:25-1293(-)